MEGSYSTKSDIYSVGFVIWELALRIVKGTYVALRRLGHSFGLADFLARH